MAPLPPETMRRTLLLLAPLLLAPLAPAALAQQPVPLSAEEAVDRGLEHNAAIRASRADAAEANAALRMARAAQLPAVNASASYTRLSNVPEVDFQIPGMDTTFTLFPVPLNQVHSEVRAEVPLFAGFRVQNHVRAAASRADAAALLAQQQEADAAFEIRAAYYRLLQAAAVLAAVDQALLAVQEHERRVGALLEEGAALRIDLLSAQTRRSEVRLDRVEAANALALARLELNRLIGLPLDTPVNPASPDSPLALPDVDTLVAAALDTGPQLAALGEHVRALEAEVAASRAGWLPEVAAVGRFVYSRPNPLYFIEQDQFRGHWELGLAARWSLFDTARPAGTDAARARLAAAEARLAEARDVLTVDVMRRHLEAQRAAEAVAVAGLHVEEAEEAFRVVERQFAEGAALPAQVLEAEQVLRAAQARLAQAAADRAIAQAALLNAAGEVR
jgi:outer membrane protein